MFTAQGLGRKIKEADSFTSAHRKKHNELSIHTHTHIEQTRGKQNYTTGYNERSAS